MNKKQDSVKTVFEEILTEIIAKGTTAGQTIADGYLRECLNYFHQFQEYYPSSLLTVEAVSFFKNRKQARMEGAKADYFTAKAAIAQALGNNFKLEVYLMAARKASKQKVNLLESCF